MKFVKPEIFLTFKSKPDNDEIYRWLIFIGCSIEIARKYAYPVNDCMTAAERGVELFGRRCYMSFELGLNPNITRIRDNIVDYIDNILKAKHGSVLEHITFTFCIENVSRVFTAEMNRHRAGVAISEGSMRYIRYNDIPIVDVPSFTSLSNQLTVEEEIINSRRNATRGYIRYCVANIESVYNSLVKIWQDTLTGPEFLGKKHITSMLRRIIPMGVATGGVWTFNIRSLRHMLTMRTSPAAEEEILLVAGMILGRMQQEEPAFFGDFTKDKNNNWKPKYEKV